LGAADAAPSALTVSAWRLRRAGQSAERAAENLGCYLRDLLSVEAIDLIAVEEYMNPAASASADATIMALLLRGALEGVAGCYGVQVREATAATIRVHFCGKATAVPARKRNGPPKTSRQKALDREETKRMVWRRAVTLGYLERGGAEDFDKADAAALFDYSAATFARATRPLALFQG
jgi:hypothetical protein